MLRAAGPVCTKTAARGRAGAICGRDSLFIREGQAVVSQGSLQVLLLRGACPTAAAVSTSFGKSGPSTLIWQQLICQKLLAAVQRACCMQGCSLSR